MRAMKILLLASTILFLISGGLYFFAPDFKEKALSRGKRKVTYSTLKTLDGREQEIRLRISNDKAAGNSDVGTQGSQKDKAIFLKALSQTENYLRDSCDRAGSVLEEYSDLIDENSKLYHDRSRVESVLNVVLGDTFGTITELESNLVQYRREILKLSTADTNANEFEKLLLRYDAIILKCGMNDVIGPLILTLSGVVSGIDPRFKRFLVNGVTNLSMAYSSVQSFDALFLGAGILRNMNSHGLLNKNETYDLQVLSQRLRQTNDNYAKELRDATTLEEKKDVFRYYSTEALVLAELFKEFAQKVQATY